MQKLTINKSFILNSIFCFFPISFILGNLVINLNIFILALLTVTLFLKEILKLKFNSLDKLLFLFFSFTLISLIINYTEHFILDKIFPKIIFIKTIFFIKYLILYIILRFLISKNLINVNLFKAICAICTLIVSVDIIFQFVNGKNIINMVPHFSTHYSGFFGKELIAGGYIQKFSLFIFFLPFFLKEKNFFKTIIQLILFLIILFSIILSGNRMPLVLFLVVASFVFFIFLKKKKFFLIFLSIMFFVLLFAYKNIMVFQNNMSKFYYYGNFLISSIFDSQFYLRPVEDWQKPYVTEFQCGKATMKLNPFFGGGIRSYRAYHGGCNTHPHNYYIEIISDLGIFGLLIILFFMLSLFKKSLKYFLSDRKICLSKIHAELNIPVFLILFVEFFPFRTSGSFFSTNNATIIFIMIAMLVSFCDKNNKNV